MSIKITTKKTLDSNDFKRIVIKKEGQLYRVNILKDKIKTPVEQIGSLTTRIKDLSEEEQILEIIKYYLANHKINRLEDGYIDNYYSKFAIVESEYSIMALQVPPILSNQSIISLIRLKYFNDRYRFVEENKNVKNISIYSASSYSEYKKEFINNPFSKKVEPHIQFSVNSKIDWAFVEELIRGRLNEYDVPATFETEYIKDIEEGSLYPCGLYLKCGDLRVASRSSYNIDSILDRLCSEHNKKLEENKKLQLKLEGF